MEVIYLGLRQTPEAIAKSARDEDADVIGISMHNGAHLTLAEDVLEALRALRLSTPLVIGGIVPDDDRRALIAMGVAAVLGPGAPDQEVVRAVEEAGAK
jgi:methylmalonyl-CoA mutase C-terminal domain/subunit